MCVYFHPSVHFLRLIICASRSVDVERICEGMEYIHEMWAALASIALSIVILYSQVNGSQTLLQRVILIIFLCRQLGPRSCQS